MVWWWIWGQHAEELALVLDTKDPEVGSTGSMMDMLKTTVGIGTFEWEDKRKLLYKGQMCAEWRSGNILWSIVGLSLRMQQ